MSELSICLQRLRGSKLAREQAIFDLVPMVAEQLYTADEKELISHEIRRIYALLDTGARASALGILCDILEEGELHELVRDELSYAYTAFKDAHSYLVSVLYLIEEIERRDTSRVGEYFELEKQFKLAFDLINYRNLDETS